MSGCDPRETRGERPPQCAFHEGERRVQERLGVENPHAFAKLVRPFLTEQHRAFHAGISLLVVAARDDRGFPRAHVLTGEPGFVRSPDDRTLHVSYETKDRPALGVGRAIGMLGIELATRRRNRANGRVVRVDPEGFEVAVDQSFGNCPKHIRPRRLRPTPQRGARTPRVASKLSPEQLGLVRRAETLFAATGHPTAAGDWRGGMDASHRGGPPGFVQAAERWLRLVDLPGNNHYSTLGNLELDSRIGLTFADFQGGDVLQITGRACVDYGAVRRIRQGSAGRARWAVPIEIRIEEVAELPRALRLLEVTP